MNGRIKKKRLNNASKIVLNELLKNELYRGVYDPDEVDPKIMLGIEIVIDAISDMANADITYSVQSDFMDNKWKSEGRDIDKEVAEFVKAIQEFKDK